MDKNIDEYGQMENDLAFVQEMVDNSRKENAKLSEELSVKRNQTNTAYNDFRSMMLKMSKVRNKIKGGIYSIIERLRGVLIEMLDLGDQDLANQINVVLEMFDELLHYRSYKLELKTSPSNKSSGSTNSFGQQIQNQEYIEKELSNWLTNPPIQNNIPVRFYPFL